MVSVESRLGSVCEELKAANEMICKLRAEVQTIRNQLVYNQRWASNKYSCAMSG